MYIFVILMYFLTEDTLPRFWWLKENDGWMWTEVRQEPLQRMREVLSEGHLWEDYHEIECTAEMNT